MAKKKRVNKVKLDKLCGEYGIAYLKKRKLKAEIKKLDERLAELDVQIPGLIADTGQSKWELDKLGNFAGSYPKYVSIVDQKKLQAYLKKHKLGHMVVIGSKSIESWAKEWLEEQMENSEKLRLDSNKLKKKMEKELGLSFYEKEKVSFTKGNKKEGRAISSKTKLK